MDTTINVISQQTGPSPPLPPHEFVNNTFDDIINKLNNCIIKCEQNQSLIIKLFEILHKK